MKQNFSDGFYQMLVEHSPVSLLVVDADGKIIYCTKPRVDGMTLEETLQKTIYDLVDEGYLVRSTSVEALREKKTVSGCVTGNLTNPKNVIITTSVPLFDESGNLRYVAAYTLEEEQIMMFGEEIELQKNIIQYLTETGQKQTNIITVDPTMLGILDVCKRIAQTDGTVLLYGESGTGKDVLSRYIHNHSARVEAPFIAINCATIAKDLMESELFGYAPGSFTGAKKEGNPGLFELADGGTLFLDEIAELTLPMQSMLLRVLETGEIRRIGDSKEKKVNVRIIGATNEDLAELVKEGHFREDLYYRINVLPITIPPLRQRVCDISLLAQYFLGKFNRKYHRNVRISESVMHKMEQYGWPGNVREVRNIIERMVITEMVEFDGFSAIGKDKAETALQIPSADKIIPLKEAMKDFENRYFETVYEFTGKNILRTAEYLKIHPSSVYKKLAELKKTWGLSEN